MNDCDVARVKEFDTEAALDQAMGLFWRRGYEATSMQDLVDTLGVNRSSLYATFGDKGQLFGAVMQRYDERVSTALHASLAPPAAGRDAMEAYLMAVVASITSPEGGGGCLMLNASMTCVTAPAPLLDRATQAVRGTEAGLLAALRRDPNLRGRRDLPSLARFFAAQSMGLAVLARAGVGPAELKAAARIALRVLEEPA